MTAITARSTRRSFCIDSTIQHRANNDLYNQFCRKYATIYYYLQLVQTNSVGQKLLKVAKLAREHVQVGNPEKLGIPQYETSDIECTNVLQDILLEANVSMADVEQTQKNTCNLNDVADDKVQTNQGL